MKSFLSSTAAVAALLVASTGQALAFVSLPEPGSIALVAVGLGAAVYFLHKGKKK